MELRSKSIFNFVSFVSIALRLLPNIESIVVDVDHGVGVLRKRENKHPLSQDWIDFLSVSPLSMLNYELFREKKLELLRFMTVKDMEKWLDEEE